MDTRFSAIERLVAEDRRSRGIGALVQWGALEAAARSLAQASRVAVISGFYLLIPQAGETDGPPGAKAVGEALKTLGIEVAYVTDAPHLPLFQAMGLPVTQYEPDWLEGFSPSHLLAIERPGRAGDNRYYSMAGMDITSHTQPLDDWFLRAPELKISTIGVGDGGNEIGMGNVMDLVKREIPNGARIASVVPVDHLIVCGVSNFGAYGLVAGLSLIANQNLLPSDGEARQAILACVEAGACCGHTFQNAPLVDGTPLETTQEVLAGLRALID